MCEKSPAEIQSPYLSEDIPLKKRTPFQAQMAIFKLRSWKFLTHHPMCSEYEEHFFRIGELGFCVGCSMIYLAFALYTILFFTVPSIFRYNYLLTASFTFIGFGIAIIHKILHLKHKWLKAFSRFVAGFGISAYFALIIQTFFLPKKWWLGLILLSLFFLGNRLYGISRGAQANRKKCFSCPLARENLCDPERNTNIRVRKVFALIGEELKKSQQKIVKESEVKNSEH